jgi:hypothetical protein
VEFRPRVYNLPPITESPSVRQPSPPVRTNTSRHGRSVHWGWTKISPHRYADPATVASADGKLKLQRYGSTCPNDGTSSSMKKLLSLSAAAFVAFLGGFISLRSAAAQTADEPFTGSSWRLVSGTVDRAGKKIRLSLPRLQGFLMFDGNNHFLIVITHFGRSRPPSNSTAAPTPRGSQATWQRSVASFGSYSINESDHTISAHIDSSTFPKWVGTDQKRQFTLVGDTLRLTNSSASGPGTTADLVWKRVK